MNLFHHFRKWVAERHLISINLDLAASRERLDDMEMDLSSFGYCHEGLVQDVLNERARVKALEVEQTRAQVHYGTFG